MTPTLIYCADGNKRFASIAVEHGLKYGARLPGKVYLPPYFSDQNWKKPEKEKYMAMLAKHRPVLATVLDYEYPDQFREVMGWAELASCYSETVIIIPKVIGSIGHFPPYINQKPVRLGYSAATSFAGTKVPLGDFRGYPVHCLGGSPAIQMDIHRKIGILSADGNMIAKMARKCQFYSPGFRAKNNSWPRLKEAGLGFISQDAIYLAMHLTCIAVPLAWDGISGTNIYEAQLAYLESQNIKPEFIRKALL